MAEPHGLRRGGKPYRLLRHLMCCKRNGFMPTPADRQIFDVGAVSRLVDLGYLHEDTCLLTVTGKEVAERLK